MPVIVVASEDPQAGRTTVSSGLGALLAEKGAAVHLARLRSGEGDAAANASAEDDARQLASVPGCTASQAAVTEQDALVLARDSGQAGVLLVEVPPGNVSEVAGRLSARVVFVTSSSDRIAAARTSYGNALAGIVMTRVPERQGASPLRQAEAEGAGFLATLPEDRQLAGPSIREIAETLHASRLVEHALEDEALEYVMLGPISADPGQPYFLQHGSKAVINRFDKMDLHLAALATEPECLILTGGQLPSPYLLDRVSGNDFNVTVLLAPEGTVRTVEVLDGLFGKTRFIGTRKLTRAIELFRTHADAEAVGAAVAQ